MGTARTSTLAMAASKETRRLGPAAGRVSVAKHSQILLLTDHHRRSTRTLQFTFSKSSQIQMFNAPLLCPVYLNQLPPPHFFVPHPSGFSLDARPLAGRGLPSAQSLSEASSQPTLIVYTALFVLHSSLRHMLASDFLALIVFPAGYIYDSVIVHESQPRSCGCDTS